MYMVVKIFGLAHVHHLIERSSTVHWQQNLVVTTVQFTYTYLFGVFSAFLFVRTGHLIAPMVKASSFFFFFCAFFPLCVEECVAAFFKLFCVRL
jgi:membrane protease YdiL (CAAX protease family)